MKRTTAAAALVLAGLLGLTMGPAQVTAQPTNRPLAYNTGDSGELIEWLPAHFTGSVTKYTVYCIDLGGVPVAGEVLSVAADFEITNDLPYTLLVSSQLLLATACSASGGVEISEGSGTNMPPDIRHATTQRAASIQMPLISGDYRYVVLKVWAMSGSGQWQSGDELRVEQDYGRMSVLRWP